MNCLVTGGSGFIGQNLIKGLLRDGHKVSSLDIIEPIRDQDDVTYHKYNFISDNIPPEIFKNCDVIFHLACTTIPYTSNLNSIADYSDNVIGTTNLLNLSVKYSVKKFVFLSSGGTVYGIPEFIPITEIHPTNPICSYGISKLTIEKYLRLYSHSHNLETCSIRLANPYGPGQRVNSGQGVIINFCYKALKNEEIEIWGNGIIKRDFIYIDDVVEALLLTLKHKTSFEINIGYGKAISVSQIINYIETITEKKILKVFKEGRSVDVPLNQLDISLAEKELSWRPKTTITNGLIETIQWIDKNMLLI